MDLEKKAAVKETELAIASHDIHRSKNQLKDAERRFYRAEGAVLVLRDLMVEQAATAEPPAPTTPPAGETKPPADGKKKPPAAKKKDGEPN